MPDWLRNVIHGSVGFLADGLRWVSDAALGRLNDTQNGINSFRNDALGWIWWFFNDVIPSWVPGRDWVRDALLTTTSWAFDQPLRITDAAIRWFWDYRAWDWNEWTWVARVLQFREDLKFTLDQLWRGLQDWVGAVAQSIRDWVNATWTGFWDAIGAALQGLRDWVNATWTGLWDAVGARLQELRDWTTSLVDEETDPIRQWIANAQAALDWIGQVNQELQAFLDNPAAWLWAKWERQLWPYVESWLVKVWDGVF